MEKNRILTLSLDQDLVELIRDTFANLVDYDLNHGEDSSAQEDLNIVNECCRAFDNPTFKDLSTWRRNMSGTWAEIELVPTIWFEDTVTGVDLETGECAFRECAEFTTFPAAEEYADKQISKPDVVSVEIVKCEGDYRSGDSEETAKCLYEKDGNHIKKTLELLQEDTETMSL